MRQPRARSASPNAIRPRSCCSPGRQASTAAGPIPRPQPRARPSSRPRRTPEAKCSWATDASPRAQRSPSSRRYGRTTSLSSVSTVATASSRSRIACARGSSNAVQRVGELFAQRRRRQRGRRRFLGDHGSRARAAAASAAASPSARCCCMRRTRSTSAGGVEAQAAGRARRAQEPVATLPRAQQLGAHPGALAQLSDSQEVATRHGRYCTQLRQSLDNMLTRMAAARTVPCSVHSLYRFRTGSRRLGDRGQDPAPDRGACRAPSRKECHVRRSAASSSCPPPPPSRSPRPVRHPRAPAP